MARKCEGDGGASIDPPAGRLMSTTYRSSVPQSHFVLFLPQRPRYAHCAVPGANKELRRLITLRDHDRGEPATARGRLKIGDDWNAITIIALSQSSPLKAIAELVENSIDAKAHAITITRAREHGRHFLAIRDDGEGVPRDGEGKPDFRYVATHICDSVKRRLKADGSPGLQGEFGIGLLSFWTVGEELKMTSTDADRRAYQMIMRKGDPGYSIAPKRLLFGESGTEVRIAPLLDGVRALSGEKIQWYLAAELRDRIRQTGVRITIVDRLARKQYAVEPRQYEGRLLHQLPTLRTPLGDIYVELYLHEPDECNRVALYRCGTRVVDDLTLFDHLSRPPWNARWLQGHLDAPYLELTPGTRAGVIHDSAYTTFCEALAPLEQKLIEIIEAQCRAEEEQASRASHHPARLSRSTAGASGRGIRLVRHRRHRAQRAPQRGEDGNVATASDAFDDATTPALGAPEPTEDRQRQFFSFPGPLFSVAISPASSVARVGAARELRALPRDRSRRRVEDELEFHWEIIEGLGTLAEVRSQTVTYFATEEPELASVRVTVRQRDITCASEALITVTNELLAQINPATTPARGLPGYTFERAPGESWRSKFDAKHNLIVINNGHRDFVYASRAKSLKLRYLVRLYAKELVLHNFVGLPADHLLERMVELSLRTEEHL
jgi:Histidine kinase-, DNA gyrase B-, and HSP90-like ATPase